MEGCEHASSVPLLVALKNSRQKPNVPNMTEPLKSPSPNEALRKKICFMYGTPNTTTPRNPVARAAEIAPNRPIRRVGKEQQ